MKSVSSRYQYYRRIKDRISSQLIRLAATSVILALTSLFIFLLWETLPLFRSATLQPTPVSQTELVFTPAPQANSAAPPRPAQYQTRDAIWLHGQASVIISDPVQGISQWFVDSTQASEPTLRLARHLDSSHADTRLLALPGSKRFIRYDSSGKIQLYHATSNRHLASYQSSQVPLAKVEASESGDTLRLTSAAGQQQILKIHNPHPEFSWAVLWQPWLYEGHQQPDYIWQTTANTDQFEAKYSFVPLSIGTLKAALYALLFAIPLAVLAAIYTACFLGETARAWIKPTVELAEAFPTVVLGFIAGLWLAPLMEQHLALFLSLLLLTPVILLLCYLLIQGLGWQHQTQVTHWTGLPGILLLLLLALGLAAYLGLTLERYVMGGDLIHWLAQRGIDYQQRNGLVIGLMMGIAIMPVIFSLTEDALTSVPESLRQGAMALGASPWQAVARVILPTAASGIFAAVMIGLGRALGETMILLMASGNSPVSDFSLFEGMRTLAANLAIETPEAMQGSTHYRILILSALLLFLLTFFMNTLAAVVRENLYRHYRRY